MDSQIPTYSQTYPQPLTDVDLQENQPLNEEKVALRPLIVKVAVDAPLKQLLDYQLPPQAYSLTKKELTGRCCVVPLAQRQVMGVVVGVTPQSAIDDAKLRQVVRVLTEVAPLSPHWLELTRFTAEYYQHGWGEVAIPALPPLLRRTPGPRFLHSLKKLRNEKDALDLPNAEVVKLTSEQQEAVNRVLQSQGFKTHLLHGVTGSGKTEVYLEIAAQLLAQDPQAQVLFLVPEINLTPQLQQRIHKRLPQYQVVSLHSGMADAERSAAWLAGHEGKARIVLGTRLAVFASLPHLALIIVDEEHDSSLKAGDGVRYSARDLAIKRGQIETLPVVLGSATPALESWVQTERHRYDLLPLNQRAGGTDSWPQIETIDLKTHPLEHGFALPVIKALKDTYAAGHQSLVFINRRGYAPVIGCDVCGWLSGCPACDTFAAFHKVDTTLRCHRCGWQSKVPTACPTCGNRGLNSLGQGTQRVEEALLTLLPTARITRIDRDSARRKTAVSDALAAVHAGQVDVLVGTQMIAKGHDFREVALVVVLNADAQLVASDFRAPERLFATLLQVAGRAGRAGHASRVLIQTRFPNHPLLQTLAQHDFRAFAQTQLVERKAARLPPFVHHALLTAEAKTMESALSFLRSARQSTETNSITLYDVVPMPLAKLAGVFRAQLLVESASRTALQNFLTIWLVKVSEQAKQYRPRIRWQIEVDPLQI